MQASTQKEELMARQSSLSIELTGLGQDLASAMSQMKSSNEFSD